VNPFELVGYNWDEQKLDIRINYPVKQGFFLIKDIDLETTIYKMKLWDMTSTLYAYMVPTPRRGFDFQREDFGGFLFELIDEGVVIHKEFLRFRNTNLFKFKQDIDDFHHPVFMNYREFFVEGKYSEFDLEDCQKVFDGGASIGLFTRFMINKGAKEVIAVECDQRSVEALRANFYKHPQVKIVDKAISNIEGQMEMLWKEDNPLVNSLDSNSLEFYYENPDKKMVETTTLEQILRQHGWNSLDLLKLDIEGSEYSVIDSTPDYVFDFTDRILLEYHWPQGRLEAIVERFGELGFKYKFEDDKGFENDNGTVFFYRG
jgi:FkbM family methyltransferase